MIPQWQPQEAGASPEGNIVVHDGKSKVPKHANIFHVYLLGIALTIGGLHINWSLGLAAGFTGYIIALLVVSVGNVALILCSAEQASILPFSGGSYGFARVTLGPFIGYIVGYCDAFRCLSYVIGRVFLLGMMATEIFDTHQRYEPLYWLIFFIPCVAFDSLDSVSFWRTISVFSLVSLLVTTLYVLSSSPNYNFEHNVIQSDYGTKHGFDVFLLAISAASRVYLGITTIPLCSEEVKNPREVVPKAMIAAVSTVFVYAVVVVFCVSSHWPGVHKLSTSRFPLVYGFMESFGIERKRALLLSFPAVYATCFGYSYSYGRLMCSLARSGMLPKFMSGVRGERESPIVAMIGGNLLTFCVMLILNYTEAPQECITGAGLIATFIVVFSVFASFCIFRIKFTTLKKEYSNPFGMASAVVGSVIFILPVLYVVFFRSFSRLTLIVSGMFLTLISLYYYFWARYTLCYSKEEQSILLVLYVMKANRMRKKPSKPKFTPYKSKSVLNKTSKSSSSHSNSSSVYPAEQFLPSESSTELSSHPVSTSLRLKKDRLQAQSGSITIQERYVPVSEDAHDRAATYMIRDDLENNVLEPGVRQHRFRNSRSKDEEGDEDEDSLREGTISLFRIQPELPPTLPPQDSSAAERDLKSEHPHAELPF